MWKAVLFDLDDTLYSRFQAARDNFPAMFRAHLYPERSDAFLEEAADFMMRHVKRNSMIHEDAFAALLEKYPPDIPYVREDCVAHYYAHMPSFAVPFPDTLPTVCAMRDRGIKTGIVTNVAAEQLPSQRRKIEVMGLAPYFDCIVYSGEFGIHKPDPRIFHHAASLLGFMSEECLFVGDDPHSDVEGALGAGMEVVWIDRYEGENPYAENSRVHRVKSLSEYFNL